MDKKIEAGTPARIRSISEFHKLRGLPPPEHPLISVVDYASLQASVLDDAPGIIADYYLISVKRGMEGKMRYGQQTYDHDNGVLSFMAPKQLLKLDKNGAYNGIRSGWLMLIHPDFLWNTALTKNIRQYEFFGYAVNEALFLSEKEEAALNHIAYSIRQEYQNNIDKFSQNIIISQIETLLNYAERFYQRQFITRKKSGHQVLEQMEVLLRDYFSSDELIINGIPTVHFVAEKLHLSAGYLGALLKTLTGMNTQQHIHEKLIELAKEKLSTTQLSVSEIAYALGFEHSQSFNKLFKSKTNLTPVAFRQSFHD